MATTTGYEDLPSESKDSHDEIATTLGLTLEKMTEYDVILAIVRKIAALEANET